MSNLGALQGHNFPKLNGKFVDNGTSEQHLWRVALLALLYLVYSTVIAMLNIEFITGALLIRKLNVILRC
jgi:hypothetical protein